MARVTRSSKISIAEDDTAFTAAQIPLPDTPTPKALAPTDLTVLNTMISEDSEGLAIAQQMKNLKAAYRNALGMTKKGKKNKNRNKGRHGELADAEQIMGSIEQIENVDNTVGHLHPAGVTPNTAPLPISNEARGAAMKDTVSDSKDAKASQSHFTQPILSENTHPVEAHMITPTKSKTKTLEEIERAHISKSYTDSTRLTAADEEEDSFIEQITSRSPAKPVSRIEDSLEEFDNLEDAIDAIDQATLAEQIVISSTKKKVSIADGVSPSREPRASPRRVMASKSSNQQESNILAETTLYLCNYADQNYNS
ncbi:carboxylesterase family protein [Rutstroemia sp. NJR-2017a BBW]|nr:carboxylesterase family protein [Rutstroemia sp. NJR-2017a BBW]